MRRGIPTFLKVAVGTGAVFVGSILFALVLSVFARKTVPFTLADRLASLAPEQRAALQDLCRAAAIDPARLALIRVWPREISTTPFAVAIESGAVQALRISGTALRDMQAVAHLGDLESLWLDRNQIAAVEGVHALRRLRELNLRGNKLTSISRLPPALEVFDAGDNQLTSIDGIASAASLKQAYLGRNAITSATPLAELRVLAEVDLDHNQLDSIEPLLAHRTLRRLYVRNNRFASPPHAMRNGRPEIFADP